MSRLEHRVKRLEKSLGTGIRQVRVVYSDEEEASAREEIGEGGLIIYRVIVDAGGGRVPYTGGMQRAS